MDLIIGAPRTGKTTKLIEKAFSKKAIIVCYNQKECQRIEEMANRMNLEIKKPISYQDFTLPGKDRENKFLIDDILHFLAFRSNYYNIIGCTISSQDVNLEVI